MAEYSDNKLTNPSAETGTTSSWTANNVSVANGGTDGSKCFQFAENASMYQVIVNISKPYAFEIKADFVPASEYGNNPDVMAYVEFGIFYIDSTRDIFNFPMRNGNLVVGNIGGTPNQWYHLEQIVTGDESKTISSVRLMAVTFKLTDGGYFDNLSVRKELDNQTLINVELASVTFSDNGFTADYGESGIKEFIWTKDENGRITKLDNVTDGKTININWT